MFERDTPGTLNYLQRQMMELEEETCEVISHTILP